MDNNNLLTIAVVLIIVVAILGLSGDNTGILGLVRCLTLAAVAV